MQAMDIMTRQVVTVSPDTAVRDVADLLVKHNISAVPVIDADGKVLGIISEGDLMRRPESETEGRKRSWWLQLFTGTAELAHEFNRSHGQRAANVMTTNVVVVDKETPVAEIAQTLEEKHIKRVPVVENGKLVGIVSRSNLIRGLATARRGQPVAVSKDDRELQGKVLDALRKQPWANLGYVNATVDDGVVHLWGFSESPDQRKAYEVAASEVAGVKTVQNHLASAVPGYYWAE